MAMESVALRLQADMIVASTWRKFQHVVELRVSALETLSAHAYSGNLTVKVLHAGRYAAHNLHGEMATFGGDHGSALAAEIELLLEAEEDMKSRWERLDVLVKELRREYNLLAARYATADMRVH